MKTASFLLFALSVFFSSSLTHAKEGAQVTPVDKNNKPVGPSVPLPDCRSCKVKETAPNKYEVTVPDRVKEKVKTGK